MDIQVPGEASSPAVTTLDYLDPDPDFQIRINDYNE